MDERTPIEMLTDMLAAMTERARLAEKQRDEARERANDWYSLHNYKDAELKKAKEELAQALEELKKYTMPEGEKDNDKAND